MEIIAAVLAAALVGTIILFLRHIGSLERAWTAERRELMNRVQAPDRIPLSVGDEVELPDREPDEWARVGQVQVTREWLEADD